jgi:hypothetical protein
MDQAGTDSQALPGIVDNDRELAATGVGVGGVLRHADGNQSAAIRHQREQRVFAPRRRAGEVLQPNGRKLADAVKEAQIPASGRQPAHQCLDVLLVLRTGRAYDKRVVRTAGLNRLRETGGHGSPAGHAQLFEGFGAALSKQRVSRLREEALQDRRPLPPCGGIQLVVQSCIAQIPFICQIVHGRSFQLSATEALPPSACTMAVPCWCRR